MKRTCMKPPSCCVVVELEQGAFLGYRRAILLDEIRSRGSLTEAAEAADIQYDHALQLLQEMNGVFHAPLVDLYKDVTGKDKVQLTRTGEEMVSSYWRKFASVWTSIIEEHSRYY